LFDEADVLAVPLEERKYAVSPIFGNALLNQDIGRDVVTREFCAVIVTEKLAKDAWLERRFL